MLNNVRTKNEFLNFLKSLNESYKNDPAMWTNKSIEDYLDALIGCVESMEGFYENQGDEMPTDINWSVFADLLDSARICD